jgi:prepilin-type N-terminal cleavage/methylation domain-containing protein
VLTRGFTFIEILIVLAIMAIMAAVSLAGMSRYGARQQHLQLVVELKSGLTEARSKSMASLEDTTYGVYVGPTTIEYFSGSVVTPGSGANQIVAIANGMDVIPHLTGAATAVVFARVTGEPDVVGTIDVVDTKSIATTTITIYASGLVE